MLALAKIGSRESRQALSNLAIEFSGQPIGNESQQLLGRLRK